MFLYQSNSGYCYNSDSIFLYDFISQYKPKGTLLDVGCGVGIISLLLSRDFTLQTSIIDKQDTMLQYAVHNYTINGMQAKSYHEDFLDFQSDAGFDYIISNPPFYDAAVKQSENTELNIARYAQHLPIRDFIQKVKKLLNPRGYFIFCYDAKQVDILLQELRETGINPEKMLFIHSKLDRDSKLVMIAARKNSKSMLQVLAPLVVFDEDNKYMPKAEKVLIRANTHSIKGDY